MNRSQSWSPSHAVKEESSGAGVMFMKGRAPEPELCHFYDDCAALLISFFLFAIKSLALQDLLSHTVNTKKWQQLF